MAKIMLVEDDDNLREIYGARLIAEGHDIVSAKDGEEALALAVKEKPDLIISDVMMPRISGFDMLDILRNAPETKNTKVIMMTALSQAEDKSRADSLGADRYLVKSQVTLEDVTNVVREVLSGEQASQETAATTEAGSSTSAETLPLSSQPAAESSQPAVATAPDQSPDTAPASLTEVDTEQSAANQPAETTETSETAPVETTPTSEITAPNVEEVAGPAPEATPSDSVPPLTTSESQTPVEEVAPASSANQPATALSALDQTAEPPAAPTVEAIANPNIEVLDDQNTENLQAPPSENSSAEDQGSDTKPVEASDESDLPPIVEPGSSSEPIKVELPVLPEDQPASSDSSESPATAENTTEQSPQTEEEVAASTSTVGPSLTEALQAEQQESAQPPSTPVTPIVVQSEEVSEVSPEPEVIPTEPQPSVEVNSSQGAPVVVQPDPEAVAAAQAEAEEQAASVPETAPNNLAKKVIQPLNDPSAKPDLDALLQAEERKAAVDNPTTNTVITPGPMPAEAANNQAPPSPQPQNPSAPSTDPDAAPKNDLNNIAL